MCQSRLPGKRGFADPLAAGDEEAGQLTGRRQQPHIGQAQVPVLIRKLSYSTMPYAKLKLKRTESN